jgi:hypothetical protein
MKIAYSEDNYVLSLPSSIQDFFHDILIYSMEKSLSIGALSILVVAVAYLGIFPVARIAQADAGTSFGGRVTIINPCLSPAGPAVWITITPSPATKQPLYIWTAATMRGVPPSSPDPAPSIIGQEVIGVADTLFYCCVPPSIPAAGGICEIPAYPYWIPAPWLTRTGQRMQYASQSLAPSTGAEPVAALSAISASTGISIAAFAALTAATAAIVAAFIATKH